MACENRMTFKFQSIYKIDWNTTTLICCPSLAAFMLELSICDRNCTAHNVLNIYFLAPYRKSLLTSGIKEFMKA